jgi:hypothetical protein
MSDNCYNFVSDTLQSVKAPYPGFIVDIVQYPKQTFAYRIYRDNIEEFSDNKKMLLFEWIKGRLTTAKKLGPPELTIGLQVENKVPGVKR